MTAQDDLRTLVDDTYPETLTNLNIILVKLGEAQTEIINEIATINDAVLDGAETAHLVALEAKRIANGWAYVETYGNYGVENLTDWRIWDYNGAPIFTGVPVGPDSILFTPATTGFGLPNLIQPGNIQRLVLSVVNTPPGPAPPPLTTLVTYQPGPPIVTVTSVDKSSVIYSPTVNWDSDPTIEPHQIAFAVGWDQLTHPVGVTGTYGLNEKKDQIDLGILIQTINRDKYAEFITVYEPYAA